MRRVLRLAMVGFLCGVLPAAALDITACDANFIAVPPGETADLRNDLDCEETTISLGRKATLRLNGFRYAGRIGRFGVQCSGSQCGIQGPGTMSGWGIAVGLEAPRSSIVINDVTFEDNDASITGSHGDGTVAVVNNVIIDGGGNWGIIATKLKAEGLRVTGVSGFALDVRTLRGSDIEVSATGPSPLPWTVRVHAARATNVRVFDNARTGIVSTGRLALRDSVVAGNGTSSGSGGIDIEGVRRPVLLGSTCGRSLDTNTGLPFGVCVND